MKQFMKRVLEYLCALNRFAIVILAGACADAIGDKYNFPWQIIVFIVVGLVVYDYTLSQKNKENVLQHKTDKFIEENRSSLSFSQIIALQQLYK